MARQAYRHFLSLTVILGVAPFLVSCDSTAFKVATVSQFESLDSTDPLDPGTGGGGGNGTIDPVDGGDDINVDDFQLKICSDLSFANLDWSADLAVKEREPFALALNVTGSFEGVSGWDNLTGNFDGQGISMGLLQQNLGQGSLQPVWTDMLNHYPTQFTPLFTTAQMTSIKNMLKTWGSTITVSGGLRIEDYGYNELDDPEVIAKDLGVSVDDIIRMSAALTAKNQASVNWAVANILTGTSVKSDWSTRFKNLSKSQGYRSLQVAYAQEIHDKAMDYFKLYKATQVRSYMVFFDIVVQNGGISSTVYNEYQAWYKSNSSATEYTRMKKLIQLRAAKSASQWQADVLSRKLTILDGKGTVHGESRDINKEYCANISQVL